MRWIDDRRVATVIQPFVSALARKQAKIDGETDLAKRRRRVKTPPACWPEVRLQLASVNYNKCWYTESKTDPGELDIDHFRPKGRVAGEVHPGYYWLAYNWRNFRIARKVSNTRNRRRAADDLFGKGDHFPLLTGVRASRPGDEGLESPSLLDPFVFAEAEAIYYASNGEPQLSPKFRDDPVMLERFKITRQLYNLDRFNGDRYRLITQIERYVDAVKIALGSHSEGVPIAADHPAMPFIEEIVRLIEPEAEFCSATRAFVATLPYWWVRSYLLRIPEAREAT